MPPIRDQRAWLVLPLVLYLAVLVGTAWVCDDAYITLRTADNVLNGHGLTWNPAERVQAYTHPLWLLLLTGGLAVTGDGFTAAVGLGLLVSAATAVLLALVMRGTLSTALLALLALALSRAFVDYSTAGLENPATHLIMLGFFIVYLRPRDPDPRRLLWLSLLAGLAALNRPDTMLLVSPPLIAALARTRPRRAAWAALAAGLLPIAVWELFSLIYYGFPFPNTAYAKLNTGIPTSALLAQGILYFRDSLWSDPLTLLVIFAALCWIAIARTRALITTGTGILLYLGYVWRIGGDFMSGRFFSPPFLVAVVLLAATLPAMSRRRTIVAAAALMIVGVLPRTSLVRGLNPHGGGSAIAASGIADERRYYGAAGALLTDTPEQRGGDDARRGRQMRAAAPTIAVEGAIGAIGYYAGPEVHIIDVLGLADPLLARLPAVRFDPNFALIRPERENWRIGHFLRAVPAGYLQTIATGGNHIADRQLAAVYDDLALITRGPLASGERLRAIIRMNLSAPGEKLALARYRDPRVVEYRDLRYVHGAEPAASQPALRLSYNGLHIRLPQTTTASRVRIALSRGNAYLFVFYRGGAITGMQPISPTASGGAPMVPCEVRVSPATLRSGYDRIGVYPMVGNGRFAAGPIELAD